ncbi:MAG: WXG100 family type VII secretion target [Anaerolineales bacterium]|nr:WXG100 family type VII secretion target [Anaerolineales bacterium]
MAKNIHMDVDSLRAVIQLLEGKKGELTEYVTDVSNGVNGLEGGDWVGGAPNQFYEDFEAKREDLMKQVDYMGALAGRLRQAIADFEAAAAKLS